MPERIPQGVAIRVPLLAFLASDHITPATSKTIAVTISKNGASAYANPNAGATNATELGGAGNGQGSYYVDLDATDTGTAGPLYVLGKEGTIDNVYALYDVVNANNAGFAGVPNAAAAAAGGLVVLGANATAISFTAGVTISNAGGSALELTSSGSNGSGLIATGNGTGDGLRATGGAGAGGDGLALVAGGGVGLNAGAVTASTVAVSSTLTVTGVTTFTGNVVLLDGLAINAPTTLNRAGMVVVGNGVGSGIQIAGGVTGRGISITTTANDGISVTPTGGHGLVLTANGASKHGAVITGGTAGTSDGLRCVAGTGGVDIRGDITGDITGDLLGTVTTVTNLVNAATSGDLTATMKASVNAEMVDALSVDTYAQPGQEAPAASQSIAAMNAYLYKAWRNRSNQTDTLYQLFSDNAVTVDQKAITSDNGVTFERGEVASGP